MNSALLQPGSSTAISPTSHIEPNGSQAGVSVREKDSGVLVLALSGDWTTKPNLPGLEALEEALNDGIFPRRVEIDSEALGTWNTGLVNFIFRCQDLCRSRHIEFGEETLPVGVQKLIRLARAVPETTDAKHAEISPSWVTRIGESSIQMWNAGAEAAAFLGSNVLAFVRMLRGRAQFRWSDVMTVMAQCGPQALGVVALINFLVGVILAFVGAVQLRQFGASIYVADLVAIGTVREMGCIMTGVILCGRTGAAFAAELGAMKVNEEIAAFKTFGISPMEFLVLPRTLGLLVMMPFLCVFADVIAITGGFIVSTSMLDVTTTEYIRRTIEAITLQSFFLGIFKGGVFGIIVAVSGCLRGLQCGTNAAAVGQATTSAVVTGITSIVAADGLFAVLCNALDI